MLAGCRHETVKSKKSKQARDSAALAALAREIGRPRFAESTRAEEEAAGDQLTSRKKKLG